MRSDPWMSLCARARVSRAVRVVSGGGCRGKGPCRQRKSAKRNSGMERKWAGWAAADEEQRALEVRACTSASIYQGARCGRRGMGERAWQSSLYGRRGGAGVRSLLARPSRCRRASRQCFYAYTPADELGAALARAHHASMSIDGGTVDARVPRPPHRPKATHTHTHRGIDAPIGVGFTSGAQTQQQPRHAPPPLSPPPSTSWRWWGWVESRQNRRIYKRGDPWHSNRHPHSGAAAAGGGGGGGGRHTEWNTHAHAGFTSRSRTSHPQSS